MIGGSFAKALKDRNLARLYGADRRKDELTLGVATGVIDVAIELDKSSLQDIDVILLATPVRAMKSVLLELKPFLSSHTLITDVGSTKGNLIAAAKSVFGFVPTNLIPGHPIAGAEKSGVLAANANLFEQHKVILTPQSDSDPILLNKLHEMWASIGAEVLSMDVDHHDAVLANSSHLPHLLAYTLVDALANDDLSQDVFRFAAGGFKDFTRIASSDPTMWRDVFLANKEAVLSSLDNFSEHLQEIRQFIDQGDGPAMFGVFTRAKSARDHFLRLQKKPTSLQLSHFVSIKVQPAALIKGDVTVSGDKKLTQKLLLLAAVSEGVGDLYNIDKSASTQITLQALRDMGVVIENLSQQHLRIHGVGLQGLKPPIAPIDVHGSMLSLYALLPVLMGQKFPVALTGAELLQQPFSDLVALMSSFKGQLATANAECLPFTITPVLTGEKQQVELSVDVGSGALLLSALLAGVMDSSEVMVRAKNFQEMAYFLKEFDADFEVDAQVIRFAKQQVLQAHEIKLPGDVVKAAWLALLGSILPGTQLLLRRVFFECETRSYLNLLSSSGAKVAVSATEVECVCDLEVAFAPLECFVIDKEELKIFEDTLLFVCVAAVYAQGTSRIEGVASLPYFLQDRLLAFIDALEKQQIVTRLDHDVLEIEGGVPVGGELDCSGDHILALAMLALGARSREPIIVRDCQSVFEEFEEFEATVEQVGFHCHVASQ